MTKSIFRYVIYVIPKKLHATKEKKLLKRFWDWALPPQSWWTDRRTTDNSALEELDYDLYFIGLYIQLL